MLAIVWGHSALIQHGDVVYRVLFSFHVPLFFMLAGVMLTQGLPWHHFVVRRARALLWPFAVVGLGVAAMSTLRAGLAGQPVWASATVLLERLAWGGAPHLQWPTLWFLPHLFLASVLTLACLPLQQRWPFSLAICVALGALLPGLYALHAGAWPVLPWSIDLLPVTLPLLWLGHRLRPRLLASPLPWWVGLLCAVGFVVLHLSWSDTLDLYLRRADRPWLAAAQALMGCGALVGAAQAICATPWLGKVTVPALGQFGQASLFVLLFHAWLLDTLQRWMPASPPGGPLALLPLVVACVFPWALWRLSLRLPWFAWALGQKTGRPT